MSTAASPATGPATEGQEDWRGVATEDTDELSTGAGIFVRARSRRLLGELLAPHHRSLWLLLATITAQNLAWLAGPFLIGLGIDVAVPALLDGDPWPLVWITAAMVGAAVLDTVLRFLFLTRSGRVGQAVLLTLRRRVFVHVQKLPLSFHERYTSGKTISRLTSDVEALAELLDEGLDNLVTALFSVLTIGVVLIVLDPPLGVVALLGFPALFWLARWFQRNSTAAYRRTRQTIAALIVQFTETFGGIRAVQAFRREPRNDELHAALNEDNRLAHHRAFWLMAVFVPGVTLIGNVVTVAVLGYGALRVIDGDLAVGVLVSFLLYLRRFFDPLQDVAMFYNSYQSAAAALEKLSGVLEERPAVAEPTDPVALPDPRGELTFDGVRFGYTDRAVLPHLDLRDPRRADRGAGRGDRRRQVDAGPAGRTLLRPARGRGAARRRAPAPADRRRPAPRGGDGDPGELPVLRDRSPTTSRSGGRARRGRRSRRPPGRSARTTSSRRCRRATTPTSTGAAGGCRPVSGSW